jgi:hypothetical protein
LAGYVATRQRSDPDQEPRGVEQKIREGKAHGGHSPFGWSFLTRMELAARAIRGGLPAPQGKPANIHERVEQDIRTYLLMCDLALSGYSIKGGVRELKARGIKNRPRNPTTYAKILRDPCYWTGIWHYGKREGVAPKKLRKPNVERHRVKASWKLRPQSQWQPQKLEGGPVISREKWEAVQEALKRNGRNGVGKPAAEDGLEAELKGLLECGLCNYSMCPWHKTTRKGRRMMWYRCIHRDRVSGKRLCPAESYPADPLHRTVFEAAMDGLTPELPALVEECRKELLQTWTLPNWSGSRPSCRI